MIREGANANVTSAAYATAVAVSGLEDLEIRITSADFVGTWDVQISHDGTNYGSCKSAVVASGATELIVKPPVCHSIKVGASAYTSGTLSSAWAGTESAFQIPRP